LIGRIEAGAADYAFGSNPPYSAKKASSRCRDGKTRRYAYRNSLVRAVMLGVVTARLGVMLLGMAGMAMRTVGVVGGLLMVTGLMVLGGLAMMLGGMFMMFGGLVVMVDGVLAHVVLPVGWLRV
jgi:hypothetical protein